MFYHKKSLAEPQSGLPLAGTCLHHDLHSLGGPKIWPSQVLHFGKNYVDLGGPKFGPLMHVPRFHPRCTGRLGRGLPRSLSLWQIIEASNESSLGLAKRRAPGAQDHKRKPPVLEPQVLKDKRRCCSYLRAMCAVSNTCRRGVGFTPPA